MNDRVPMSRIGARAAALAACLAFAGCSSFDFESAPSTSATPDAAAAKEADLSAAFAPGRVILDGFDPAGEGVDWRVGDRVLFGIRLNGSDGPLVRFVRLEARSAPVEIGKLAVGFDGDPDVLPEGKPVVVAPRHGRLTFTRSDGTKTETEDDWIAIAATVYDGNGERVGHRVVTVPAVSLREGVARPAARLRAYDLAVKAATSRAAGTSDEAAASRSTDDAETKAAHTDFTFLVTSIFGFLDVLRQHPDLEGLRETAASNLVQKPSLFSVVFGLGVTMSLDPRYAEMRDEARPLPAATAAQILPIRFTLNGTPAFSLEFSATSTAPPYHVAVGLAAIDGFRPGESTPRLEVRLLAARRG